MQQQNQNVMQNQQQPVFHNPPQVITGKDLNYVRDMLSWNLLGMKKAHFMATQCQDSEVKATLEKAFSFDLGMCISSVPHSLSASLISFALTLII